MSPVHLGATPGLPQLKLLPLSFRLELLDLLLLSRCSVTLGRILLMSQLQGLCLAGHLLTRRAEVVPLCVWQGPSDSPEVPGLQVTQQPNCEPSEPPEAPVPSPARTLCHTQGSQWLLQGPGG